MIVEAAILNGDDGTLQLGRNASDGHIVRAVKSRLDGTADEENARNLLSGIRLMHLMQLIRRQLPLRRRQHIADLLPYLRDEEKCSQRDEQEADESTQEKTPKSAGRFFACSFARRRLAPLSLRRRFVYRLVHRLLHLLSCSKYVARIRSRISARLDGRSRML